MLSCCRCETNSSLLYFTSLRPLPFGTFIEPFSHILLSPKRQIAETPKRPSDNTAHSVMPPHLTPAQAYDLFNDGLAAQLTLEQMQKSLTKLGLDAGAIPILVAAFDVDENHAIEVEEFCGTISTMVGGTDKDKLMCQFRSWGNVKNTHKLLVSDIVKGLKMDINNYEVS